MESSNLTTWHEPVCVIERRKDKERKRGQGRGRGLFGCEQGSVFAATRDFFRRKWNFKLQESRLSDWGDKCCFICLVSHAGTTMST